MHDEPSPLPILPSVAARSVIATFFFFVCFVVYGQSLENSFVRFDDGALIFENPMTRGITMENVAEAFTSYDPELYIPLTFLSYQIDYELGGIDPFVYHLHRLLLHSLNAILIAWIAFLLSSSGRVGMIAGIFWAIHPLNTEAVAWASALKDVQSTTFFLGSLIAYLYYRSTGNGITYWLSIMLFALGLLSKVMVVTLPVVLLLLDWRNGRAWSARVVLEKWPYFGLAALFGVIAVVGKTEIIASMTVVETALMAAKSTVFYLQKLVLPANLSVLYPYDEYVTIASPDFFLPIIGVLLIAGAAVYARTFTRDIPFAVAFYLITLIPTFSNFSKAGAVFVASDRYAYIPSIGFFFLFAVFVERLLSLPGRRSHMRSRAYAIGSALTVALLLLSWLAHAQSTLWHDTESLFANVLRQYPTSFIARNNLGNMYLRQQRWDDAIREFEQGLRYKQNVTLYNNLARAYGKKRLVGKAEEYFNESLVLEPKNHETYGEFAKMYGENGRIDEALATYEKAIDMHPGYAVAYLNRGSLLVNIDRIDEGVADLEKVIELDPDIPQAYYNLGIARMFHGDITGAIALYETAVTLKPEFYEAHFNLGKLYAKEGRLHESRAEMVTALGIKPGNATIEQAIKQIDEAIAAQEDQR